MWKCHIGNDWRKSGSGEGDTPLAALEAAKAKTKCRTKIHLGRWFHQGQYVYPDMCQGMQRDFETLKEAREWAKGQSQ